MKKLLASVLVAALALPAAPAFAQRNEQGEARKEMRAGNILGSREIEERVLRERDLRDQEYLGFAYDPTAMAYRLRFIKNGRVTYVDVDARTGRVMGKSR